MGSASTPIAAGFKGGSFLIASRRPEEVFTPEDLNDQQRMIARTTIEFIQKEVLPRVADLEDHSQQHRLCRELLRRAGELGLTAVDVPAAYGGLELDKITSLVVAEATGADASFTATMGGHVTIGTLPLVYFGTEEQKARYLPRLATAEMIAAYSLSEATSASDALNCHTKATLSPEGTHYLVNGTKMWTTNGGFADLFTLFAKVDGEKFTAFLVERSTPGLSVGAEEKKMGIRGSSTTPVILEDARVPVENVLGEVGKGHLIAFNILNIGRLKLGASAIGACKALVRESVRWAKERVAFGKPIADFGLIREKLGEMTVRTYIGESITYRTAGLIESLLEGGKANSVDASARILRAIQEYAVECSIAKVFGVEAMDYVTDQAVQIHGGYGYSAEYYVERAYRDSRINRIFEGTDEINRLLIVDMLLKRSLKGELPLISEAQKLMDDILSPQASVSEAKAEDSALGTETGLIEGARKAVLLVAGSAVRKYGKGLPEEQEVIGAVSNMVIEVYAMESGLLRALKDLGRGDGSLNSGPNRGRNSGRNGECGVACEVAQIAVHEGIDRLEIEARRALARIEEGDTLRVQLSVLRRFLKRSPVDVIELKRRVAERAVRLERYPF
ncbi:MAG: acyl-CoA dehydrogenase family protein [Acidobacteria bacterium]|nr:acyl-CoA dehydrogenase family protein [Acidobacteriota bacterium]